MMIWSVFGSETVGPNTRPRENDGGDLMLNAARNATVTASLLFRAWDPFTFRTVRADVPDGISVTFYEACSECFNDGVPYPDRLAPIEEKPVKAHTTMIVRAVIRVSPEAGPGEYEIPLHAETDLEARELVWRLTVFPAVLPEPKDSAIGHEYFFGVESVKALWDGTRLAEDAERQLAAYARAMKELRVNYLRLPVIELLSWGGSTYENGVYKPDYRLLDRVKEILWENGSFCRLVAAHFCHAVYGDEIYAPDGQGGKRAIPIPSSEADEWIRLFLTDLYAHAKAKGWLTVLALHLEDEPHGEGTWRWAREKCRAYMPGIPCGEPLDNRETALKMGDVCDWLVPRFEVYAQDPDFYQKRRAEGAQVWAYCCCYPEEAWWLNHFIDQPLIFPRLIAWACFSQHLDGFLHWGFNFWGGEMYGRHPNARFKGDGYIVYPADGGGVLPSARFYASLEGIEDWEALKRLEKTDPAGAEALAKAVCADFTHFSTDPTLLEKTRRTVLEKLAAQTYEN